MSTINGTTELGPASAKWLVYSPLETYWKAFQAWRKREKLRTRMVLQVHDELIFEVPEAEIAIQHKIRERMQSVVQLRVPLTVNLKQGRNWQILA